MVSGLVREQLEKALKNSSKVKITHLDDFIHYGFIQDLDDEFVLISLETSSKQVTIKISEIKGVVVWE